MRAERGAARLAGVPYGADMRLFCARGIPTVMVGTSGLELAHAVDERVRVDELAAVARIMARAVLRLQNCALRGARERVAPTPDSGCVDEDRGNSAFLHDSRTTVRRSPARDRRGSPDPLLNEQLPF